VDTRPTAGRVKEAVFNILSERLAGARFLDLYAGTGLIGIEALSRGAAEATFVESDATCCRLLKTNLEQSGYASKSEVFRIPVSRFLKHSSRALFDIVFVDPPYHTGEGEKILPSLGSGAIIRPDGVLVIEHFHKVEFPSKIGRLTRLKTYRYGDTLLSIYQAASSEPA
jgi:16S rRNA (guanine(966)-N(2))-methyltransferase RsmD